MVFLFFAAGIAAAFFVGSLLALHLGRRLGLRYRKQKAADAMAGLATVEGAIFGLMGLLLAFTISGALQRFDDRRQLVIQEAAAVMTAYDRLDRKRNLWKAAVAACPKDHFQPACSLALPALGSLFEVARIRAGASEKHPPQVIYFMLFGLGLGCSLLAGFGMAAASTQSWVHMVLFAGTLTFALYIVTDMEYPRLGLIRIDTFDHFLTDTLAEMASNHSTGKDDHHD